MAPILFKLFALTLKTVSKPLASRFEKFIMGHPVARKRVINLAQRLHAMEVNISRGAEGRTGRTFVGDISEEKAVQLASKVVSEGFVYGVAIVLLLVEVQRKNVEDREKREAGDRERQENRDRHLRHEEMDRSILEKQADLQSVLERIEARVVALEGSSGKSGGVGAYFGRWL